MKTLVQIYKSPKKDEMYLYVDRKQDLERVPEALLAQFGPPQSVMILPLEPSRKLARADAAEVLKQIDDKGFYLQMPPPKDSEMDDIGKLFAEYASKFDQDPEQG